MNAGRPARATLIGFLGILVVACGGGGGGGSGSSGGVDSGPAAPPASSNLTVTTAIPTAPVPGGGTTTVDIKLSNSGAAAATGVILTTLMGTGVTRGMVACSASGGATCPPIAGNSIYVGTMPAGSSVAFQVALAVGVASSGLIDSTVTVVGDNSLPLRQSTSFFVNAYSADIEVSGTAARRVIEGGTATYSMTVTNVGPDMARDLVITNVLDGGQTLGAVECTATHGAACPTTLGPSMTLESLPWNGSLTFTILASVPVTGATRAQTDLMTVQSAGDPESGNNSATISIEATPPNSIQLQSDPNDYIGGGLNYQYSNSNAQFTAIASGGLLSVSVDGNEDWLGDFKLPATFTQVQRGTYTNLSRYPIHDPAVGGLSWSGEGRGCSTLRGAFTVNRADYANGVLDAIDLSFEQFCDGAPAALRGQIHWTSAESTLARGPVNPPPADLWAPAPGTTPETGSYVYLQSDLYDYIGEGRTYTYTRADALLKLSTVGRQVRVSVTGDEEWEGDFQPMLGHDKLQPGYYGDLRGQPYDNLAAGGLSWSGEGRGCGTVRGWFVVDSVSYTNDELSAIELRFEQHCEGNSSALRGKIRLLANDPPAAYGPVVPPPSGLWSPALGVTPDSGNYVYLQSDVGDIFGDGAAYLYTDSDSTLAVNASGAHVSLTVSGSEDWMGDFQGMGGMTQLEPGYYGDLRRYPFHNPVKGGLSWIGEGMGCDTLLGWFVVDSVSYDANGLSSITLRFQQNCEGVAPALHGKISWTR